MVKVTHSAPVFALIVVGTQCDILVYIAKCLLLGKPGGCGAAIVILCNVGRRHLISHTIIGLNGEIHPVSKGATVVYHHIGNHTSALALVGADKLAQLGGSTKGALLIEVILHVITH